MWRNTDVAALIDWLREHNAEIPCSINVPASTASISTT
jgi:erythromycin esterase-like protein